MIRSKTKWDLLEKDANFDSFEDDTEEMKSMCPSPNTMTKPCSYDDDHNVIILPRRCDMCRDFLEETDEWLSYDDIIKMYFCSIECLIRYVNKYKKKQDYF